MYNLFVSNDPENWQGKPWDIELERSLREYTDDHLTETYGKLDAKAIAELKRFPCIFAYERYHDLAPKFGAITDITWRGKIVRVDYKILPVDPFLTDEDMEKLGFELGIKKWEMNRTHWALREINLAKELEQARGIELPALPGTSKATVRITTHEFDVALSFPGEAREVVEPIARELERRIGPDRYFYDDNHAGALARPNLDLLLQDIYGKRSKLIVVFISGDYQTKTWCGIEFRAIRKIINNRENARIMYVKTGDGNVEGIFPADGYIDARRFSPEQIAEFIEERLDEL